MGWRTRVPVGRRALSVLILLTHTGLSGAAEMDAAWYPSLNVDHLEWRDTGDEEAVAWEIDARLASDYHKFSVMSRGEYGTQDDELESSEWQFRYGRLLDDFFDVHAGIRYDRRPQPDRTYLVVGVNGLAPQWFEVDASLFVDEDGDSSARLEAEYDLRLTQRWVVQGAAETYLAFAADREIGRGAGVNDLELGLRLKYEIAREFVPYFGVHWEGSFGDTADLIEASGGDTDATAIVVGLSMWF